MNPPTTLAVYAAGLVVVFVAALGLGSVVGPVGTVAPPPAAERDHGSDVTGHDGAGGDHTDETPAALSPSTTGGPA